MPNPLFNDNKIKLGIFAMNGKGGAQTLVPEAHQPSWRNSVETAKLADDAGLEAIVPYSRWKGYFSNNPTHASGVVMDVFTWAAGIAQATSHSAVFATTNAPAFHPLTIAKQCATIDIISNGRFALNVVGGWNKPELEMFGVPINEHDERYDRLEEWLTIVRRLWTETPEFDYEGAFYKVYGATSQPHPIQQHIPIMNAGGSGRGQEFACKNADVCFVILKGDDPGQCKAQVQAYKQMARDHYGREVQVWIHSSVTQRDTRREAEDYLHYFAVENEDTESVDVSTAILKAQSQLMTPEEYAAARVRFAACAGGSIIVGTAQDIADKLEMYSQCGIDGVLMTWVDYIDGIKRLSNDVLPILETRGLRAKHQF